MNNQLIEKVIKANGETCPDLVYQYPLLDENVAKALSRSFVKILNISKENSNINNNTRFAVLENIRKLCTLEPEGHLQIDDSLSESLLKLYSDQLTRTKITSIEKELDAYLIRRFICCNFKSSYEPTVNPEVVKALGNLNENDVHLDILAKDIIHYDDKFANVLNTFWSDDDHSNVKEKIHEDVAIKLKHEIEAELLSECHRILSTDNIDVDDKLLTDIKLVNLIKKSSNSSNCFQICCNVLNFLFIKTNYNLILQEFIKKFVQKVKESSTKLTFSVLYPTHLNHIVVLLDFNIHSIPEPVKTSYITHSLTYLKDLHKNNEYDFVMLLSHFDQWFDIYFV